MKKSQMALEFVLLFSMTIFIMTLVLVVFYELNSEKIDEKISSKMHDFLLSTQSEFLLASQVHDGYRRVILLPGKIEQTDYNMSIIGNTIVLSYDNVNLYSKIPNTTGNLVIGLNVIEKNNGIVYVNP